MTLEVLTWLRGYQTDALIGAHLDKCISIAQKRSTTPPSVTNTPIMRPVSLPEGLNLNARTLPITSAGSCFAEQQEHGPK